MPWQVTLCLGTEFSVLGFDWKDCAPSYDQDFKTQLLLHGMTLDVHYSSHCGRRQCGVLVQKNLDLIDVINEAYIIEMKTTVV